MKKALPFLLFLLLFSSCHEHYDLIIRNVKLFDGKEVHEHVDLLINGDKIIRIAKTNPSKSGKEVINGDDKTIIPGLINAHAHLNNAELLKATAKSGVLTVLDLFNTAESASELRNFRDSINYSHYYSSGPVATVQGGHGTQFAFATPTLSHPHQAKSFVADRIKEGADYLKIIMENGNETWPLLTLSDETIAALINAAKKEGLKTVVHISSKEDALKAHALRANGLAHIWSNNSSPISELKLTNLSSRPFFVIPTLLVLQNATQQHSQMATMNFDAIKQEIKKLHDSEVSILAGTDCPNLGVNCSGNLFDEMLLLHECGLTPIEVLKSATSKPSISFGLKDKGFIIEGGKADFILINGDPLENMNDLKNIESVWKHGQNIFHNKR